MLLRGLTAAKIGQAKTRRLACFCLRQSIISNTFMVCVVGAAHVRVAHSVNQPRCFASAPAGRVNWVEARRQLLTSASTAEVASNASGETAGVTARRLSSLAARVALAQKTVDRPAKLAHLLDLEQRSLAPSFWDSAAEARRVMEAVSACKDELQSLAACEAVLDDATAALELELLGEASTYCTRLETLLDSWEMTRLLDMPYAERPAVLTINAGAGGTDAQDWAQLLLRMYERWATSRGFTTRLLEISEGEEAGIKSASLEIDGRHAYGSLLSEKGTHRCAFMHFLGSFDSCRHWKNSHVLAGW